MDTASLPFLLIGLGAGLLVALAVWYVARAGAARDLAGARAALGAELATTRARLDEAYGTRHRFLTGATAGGGFRSELVIPRNDAVQVEPAGKSQPAWTPVPVQW